MTHIKIIGAGSIGNHLSHAARTLGWDVDLCDRDLSALDRSKNSVYPGRYGQWDEAIRLFEAEAAPKGEYDYIFIGTPPDTHIDLALNALDEKPRAVTIEKPLCTPDLVGAQALYDKANAMRIPVFTGYDHVVGRSMAKVEELLSSGCLGEFLTLDVEFREHWGGIFEAHPWLDGPSDTYLGYWHRGGGACGEHSHALNLWQHLAALGGAGRVAEVSATMDFITDGQVNYDRLCCINLLTEDGLVGRVVQDVVTSPPKKWAHIEGQNCVIEWYCNLIPDHDTVLVPRGGEKSEFKFRKSRPDDFIEELKHIDNAVASGAKSPISMERGLDSMLVIAAAYRSHQTKRTVRIDYANGYTLGGLRLV